MYILKNGRASVFLVRSFSVRTTVYSISLGLRFSGPGGHVGARLLDSADTLESPTTEIDTAVISSVADTDEIFVS